MSDEQRREIERRIQSGDPEAQQDMLRYRSRMGEIEIRQFGEKVYELRPWRGPRVDTYGNNHACGCADLKRVVGMFCVCYGKCWCPTHGGPRCVGGHD